MKRIALVASVTITVGTLSACGTNEADFMRQVAAPTPTPTPAGDPLACHRAMRAEAERTFTADTVTSTQHLLGVPQCAGLPEAKVLAIAESVVGPAYADAIAEYLRQSFE